MLPEARRGYGSLLSSTVSSSMVSHITARYAALVATDEIEQDSAQEEVVGRLARLEERLVEHRLARKSSSLGWLFGARRKPE